MRFPVVLFDLDGTVVDSGGMILASMRYATRTVLGREVPDETLMATVGGPGLEHQLRELGGEEHLSELVRVYREHNERLHADLRCCAGVDEVLVRLKEEGRRLGIVSAKRRRTVELAFATVAVGHLFDVVVGGDDHEKQKPEPDLLLVAAGHLGVSPQDCAYVGDSPFDMRAARAAGMHAVAVTWGRIHTRAALEREEPDAVVDAPGELLAVL